jgi:hypothetical protein
MKAEGTFEVTMHGEPPYDTVDGVSLSRASVTKRFVGGLTATSTVHMLAVRTGVKDSAAYVAIERIVGTLDGLAGSFVVTHSGLMHGGDQTLIIDIVPDSGTGDLKGIAGMMTITVADGRHGYSLAWLLP